MCGVLAERTPAGTAGEGTRLKDLTTLIGVRPTTLIGYGLVVGLNKTGDRRQTLFSTQSLSNMLRRFGVVVPAERMRIENVAAVMVTSELPPFARSGGRIDVIVSSIGDARSLQGGTLLGTPLHGPDGHGVRPGPGPSLHRGLRGRQRLEFGEPSTTSRSGRVPGGGLVESSPQFDFATNGALTFSLTEPDFVTATRLAEVINDELGGQDATVADPGTVIVTIPDAYQGVGSGAHGQARAAARRRRRPGPDRHQRANGNRRRRLRRSVSDPPR